jgi:PKD repeat protein
VRDIMAKDTVEVDVEEIPKSGGNGGGSGKIKIIVAVVVVIIIIAVLAIFLTQGGDDNGDNGDNGDENHAPTADIVLSGTTYYVNQLIYFNSSALDLDGDALTFLWDFDDSSTSTDANATHKYTTEGTYNVTLKVTDEHDESDEDTVKITINEVPDTGLSVDRTQILTQPPVYTVTVTNIATPIPTDIIHFYVIDGTSQAVLIDGIVANSTTPSEYVNYNDVDASLTLSQNDNFVISDSLGTTPLGIDDGDTFRLEMDDTGNLIAEIVLEEP